MKWIIHHFVELCRRILKYWVCVVKWRLHVVNLSWNVFLRGRSDFVLAFEWNRVLFWPVAAYPPWQKLVSNTDLTCVRACACVCVCVGGSLNEELWLTALLTFRLPHYIWLESLSPNTVRLHCVSGSFFLRVWLRLKAAPRCDCVRRSGKRKCVCVCESKRGHHVPSWFNFGTVVSQLTCISDHRFGCVHVAQSQMRLALQAAMVFYIHTHTGNLRPHTHTHTPFCGFW